MIRICADLFGSKENLIRYKDSILLGISQLPAIPHDEEGVALEELKKWVSDTHLSDPFEVQTLKFLSERLFIYDPLNRTNLTYKGASSRETVLSSLTSLDPINDPSKIFKTVLNAEDKRGLRYICDEIKAKIQKLLFNFDLNEKDYKIIADFHNSLNKLEIIESPYVSRLIGETKAIITAYFSKRAHRFDVCCADTSAGLQQEAKEIFGELKRAIAHFDAEIKAEVNLADLEMRLNTSMKKVEAEKAALELQDLERNFRNQIQNYNFVEAAALLATIQQKDQTFEKEFGVTKIPHRMNPWELNSLYTSAKGKYDESIRAAEAQRYQVAALEEQQRNQQRIIEDQRRRESELQAERDRQIENTRQAEKALRKQEKKSEKALREMEARRLQEQEQQEETSEEMEDKVAKYQAAQDYWAEQYQLKEKINSLRAEARKCINSDPSRSDRLIKTALKLAVNLDEALMQNL